MDVVILSVEWSEHSFNKTGLAKLWKSHGDSGLSNIDPFNDAYRAHMGWNPHMFHLH
jgi:hypothetical protein